MCPLRSIPPILLFVISLGACGGGEESKICAAGEACGGAITAGRYEITSFCAAIQGPVMAEGCASPLTVDLGGLTVSGSMTFDADKTYQTDTTTSGSFVEVIPGQCLSMGGFKASCAQLAAALQNQEDFNQIFSSLTCTGSDSCSCTFTLKPQRQTLSGTYSTSGTTLTLSNLAGEVDSGAYCATPSQLTLLSGGMGSLGQMMGMPGMPTTTSNMVLTRK